MKKFKVYFEIYGKKFQTTIIAKDKFDATDKLKQKLIIHKMEDITEPLDAEVMMETIFGYKK